MPCTRRSLVQTLAIDSFGALFSRLAASVTSHRSRFHTSGHLSTPQGLQAKKASNSTTLFVCKYISRHFRTTALSQAAHLGQTRSLLQLRTFREMESRQHVTKHEATAEVEPTTSSAGIVEMSLVMQFPHSPAEAESVSAASSTMHQCQIHGSGCGRRCTLTAATSSIPVSPLRFCASFSVEWRDSSII